jgi:hypothetical protein
MELKIEHMKMRENRSPKRKNLQSNGWQFLEQVNISLVLQSI